MQLQRAHTKLSFEVPLAHLHDFAPDQNFLFALSFLFEDKAYAQFYKHWVGEKWIDNSTNELHTPSEAAGLAELYKEYGADVVIAPDHPDWGREKMLRTAQELVQLGVPQSKVCVVIHHPDLIGYYRSYGFSRFAVPYDFRWCSVTKLKRFGEAHFLGLVSVQELITARPPSCDTAMPIKLALQGLTLQDWIQQGCPHIHTTPEYFNLKLTSAQLQLARANIQDLRRLVHTDDIINYPKHYTQGSIEVLDFILDQKLPYLAGQVIKYVCRYRYKGGVTDLRKAEFYLRRLIDEEDSSTL